MTGFILKRLLQSLLTVAGVITAAFFLTRLAGDPSILLLPPEASPEDAARLRAALGLDQPLVVQYVLFMGKAFTGDFGMSLRQAVPAMDLVIERVPATLELAVLFCSWCWAGFPARHPDAHDAPWLGARCHYLGGAWPPGHSDLFVWPRDDPDLFDLAEMGAVLWSRHHFPSHSARHYFGYLRAGALPAPF